MVGVVEGYVYLDWAASAPLCQEAVDAMEMYFVPGRKNVRFGANANSLHAPGRAAFEAMELARRKIAKDLGASRPNEIVFTSGATESDNAALLGLARAAVQKRRPGAGAAPRVITTQIEHEAVLNPARQLSKEGFDVVFLKPDRQGFISSDQLEDVMTDDTVLVSIQAANSEVGSVQPIAELARAAHAGGALFHTDAVQALGKMPVDVGAWGVDAASFSAHKVCGPKGVGALYLKARTPFSATMLGGGQEDGRRSGTQNVCGIDGFAAACHAAVSMVEDESVRLCALRDRLYGKLASMPGVRPTVSVDAGSTRFLPNIVHVLVDDYESETLVLRLDMMGYGVSGGSACASHSLEPSHVLKAMGIAADAAHGALRISMGRYTTEQDVDGFASAFEQCL